MKKHPIPISFIAVLIVLILSISLFAVSHKKDIKTFYGRVINITDEYIELKKGRTEIIVYLSDSTKFIAKDGTEGKKDMIEICQYAEAYYTLEGTKKILNKIVIKKESDCIK